MLSSDPLHDEQIRTAARDILSRSPYAEWRSVSFGGLESLLHRIREWLQWLADMESSRPVLYYAVLASLLVFSLLLLVHVAYTIYVAIVAPRPSRSDAPSGTTPELIDDAATLARAGHFLAAARQVQLAVIELLLRRRLVDLQRSDANRVLRGRLRSARLPADLRDEMTSLVDRLERQWFRDRQEDAALYEAWHRLHRNVEMLPEGS